MCFDKARKFVANFTTFRASWSKKGFVFALGFGVGDGSVGVLRLPNARNHYFCSGFRPTPWVVLGRVPETTSFTVVLAT